MGKHDGGKEGFTLGMALLDTVPVIAFGIDMFFLSKPLESKLFLAGAILVLMGGLCMNVFKICLSVFKKNYQICRKMMPVFMGAGFILIFAALIINRKKISLAAMWTAVSTMPAAIFFAFGLIFFISFFIYFKTKFNPDSAKDNWVEEALNAITQLCFMAGVILSVI